MDYVNIIFLTVQHADFTSTAYFILKLPTTTLKTVTVEKFQRLFQGRGQRLRWRMAFQVKYFEGDKFDFYQFDNKEFLPYLSYYLFDIFFVFLLNKNFNKLRKDFDVN